MDGHTGGIKEMEILEKFLIEYGFPKSWYCIGKGMEDAICIEPYGDKWYVYYIERGEFKHVRQHSSFRVCF